MAICGGAEDIYGRLGTTKAVTPRKEGVRTRGRNEVRKNKIRVLLFSYFRKGNIIQRERKGGSGGDGKRSVLTQSKTFSW